MRFLTELFLAAKRPIVALALLCSCTQVTENPDRLRGGSARPSPQSGSASDNAKGGSPSEGLGETDILALHTPPPPACAACHESKRPPQNHYGKTDCVTCHAFPSFQGGFFAHAPKPTQCEECHARPTTVGARAYPTVGTPANFNPNDPTQPGSGHYRGKDCVSCHATPAENAPKFTFTHSKPSPEACLPCHFREGSGEHRNDNRGVELTGFGNCFNCHKNFDQTVRRNWGRP